VVTEGNGESSILRRNRRGRLLRDKLNEAKQVQVEEFNKTQTDGDGSKQN
jgi:hypothetical protein